MGAKESKLVKKDNSTLFTKEEIVKLEAIFSTIRKSCQQEDNSTEDLCFFSQFSSYMQNYWKDEVIIQHLHKTLCSLTNENEFSGKAFSIYGLRRFLVLLFKGTASEQALSISVLISEQNAICKRTIFQFVESISAAYFSMIKSHNSALYWTSPDANNITKLSRYLVSQLKTSSTEEKSEVSSDDTRYSEADIEKWIFVTPLFLHIAHLVFQTCFNFFSVDDPSQSFTEPTLPTRVLAQTRSNVLDQTSSLLLNYHLPPSCRSSWRLLYCSSQHGDSFTQLVNRVENQGAVLLVVRDSGGALFGAFSDTNLAEQADFFGGHSSFLFTLHPEFGVYLPSGHNDHYVYLNHSAHTLPNGLGFGGQLGYCGLWIDGSFSSGHSKGGPLCSTYDSPQLSSRPEFQMETVEVWGVSVKPGVNKQETSILDVDPGAKAILELVGRGTRSDGLRDEDETAGIPGEHTLPPL